MAYHRNLLDDTLRVDAYERAIRRLVKPGDVVLDVGCGIGLLAMLAARRGAKVHAVESMPIGGVAAQLIAHNGLDQHITLHRSNFMDLDPVEPVNLVVSEFMGRFLIDDGMLPVIARAKQWLKPQGQCCPTRVRLNLAPVGDFRLFGTALFSSPGYLGLDLRPALVYALNDCYQADLWPHHLLADAQEYAVYKTPEDAPLFDRTHTFHFTKGGSLEGLAGWFEAELGAGVGLSTRPGPENHWGQYIFPLPPVRVEEGGLLSVRLWLEETLDTQVWHWEGHVGGISFALESEARLGERTPLKTQEQSNNG